MLRTFMPLSILVLVAAAIAQGADKRPGAFISTPKEGASVGRTSQLTGKTFLRGQPLALVRAVEGKGQWWVQRTIQRNDRGQLQGKIQFGNELAEPGTRFAFVVVIVQTPLELELFTKSESLAELPSTVHKSAVRNVVLGKPRDADRKPADAKPKEMPPTEEGKKPPASENAKPMPGNKPEPNEGMPTDPPSDTKKPSDDDKGKPTKLGLAILKPLANAKVQRFEELVGRMESDDKPVVLVRAEGAGSQWWVQDKVTFGEGKYFKTKLRFGNDKTPPGTRFMILLVSPEPGPQAQALKPGAAFSALPQGIKRSKEVIVQLGPPKPAGAK